MERRAPGSDDRPGGLAAGMGARVVTGGVTGTIGYLTDGRDTGRERFEILHHADGHVLRAVCEIDDEALLRDVTLAMDADWRARDGFCRIVKAGIPYATMWFDIGDDSVRMAARVGTRARNVTLPTPTRIPYLGLHPLQGDALIAAIRGTEDPGRFIGIAAVTNSVSPNGDEACGAVPLRIDVAYLGREAISVVAGDFVARRYAIRWRDDWPAADLWVRDSDFTFLRMHWDQVPTVYELTSVATLP